MKWIELEIFTTLAAGDAIANILAEFGIEGLLKEKLDNSDLKAELLIKSYLPDNPAAREKIIEIKAQIEGLTAYGIDINPARIELGSIAEEDWSSSWKKYFKAQKVTESLVIKPSWDQYRARAGELIIELDPGMAFGTGLHATTTMCLEAIEEYSSRVQSLLDLGSGTGILSIGAILLGVNRALAIDIDQLAVEIATENVKLNDLQEAIELRAGNLVQGVEGKFDLVVANILPHIIWELIAEVDKVLHEDSLFIFSGINVEKKEKLKQRLLDFNLSIIEVKEREDWVTFVGQRGESNGY